jgi:nicotinate-nucleotide adenylyltransferase
MSKQQIRIGVFSGTFDPIHEGHIAFCQYAIEECELDKVFLLVEKAPRYKQPKATYEQRMSMVELALVSHPKIQQLQLMQERFSVPETLPKLKQLFGHDELWLLLGSDVVRSMQRGWPDLQTLLETMSLAIGLREDDEKLHVQSELEKLNVRNYRLFASPHRHVSSTKLRAFPSGIHEALTPLVAQYIAKHHLY